MSLNRTLIEKAKRIICTILRAYGGEDLGKVRLNKAVGFAHVHYFRHHTGVLSRYPIARLPEGPAINDLNTLMVQLEQEGRVKLSQEAPAKDGWEPMEVFQLVGTGSDEALLDGDELDSIAQAAEWIRNRSGTQASQDSHRLSFGWKMSDNGDIIDISNDALSDDEVTATTQRQDELRGRIDWAQALVERHFKK